ncbi:alpha/beta hydrolase, partial [Marinilabilia sp.]
MRRTQLLLLLMFLTISAVGQVAEYKSETNIHYYPSEVNQSDTYINERCVLDIYYPENKKDFSTIVWFHGGGLSAGHKEIPEALKKKDVCVIGVNYRLHPKVKSPKYVEDAAAAVAWTIKNIHRYGGDSTKIFVSGHSAGGYLTSMVGLDKRWLAKFYVDANQIAGLIPFSGHTI